MADCKWLQYVCFCLLVFAQNVGAVTSSCKMINDCSCRTNDGKTLDLKPVDENPGPRFTGIKDTKSPESKYTFSWNPCTPFNQGSQCKDTLVCQQTGNVYVPIATAVSSFDVDSDGIISITYRSVTGSEGKARRAIITLKCDSSLSGLGKVGPFSEKSSPGAGDKINYTSTFTSKYACPESKGLSAGSILLIVFFPLVLVYFVAGLLFNKIHKGVNSFPEMIPNHSFWGELPFLVKDGCVFTFQGIAGCCKRVSMKFKGDSYAEI